MLTECNPERLENILCVWHITIIVIILIIWMLHHGVRGAFFWWWVIFDVIFGDFFGWDWGTPSILQKITVLYGCGFGVEQLGLGQTSPPLSLGQNPNFYRKFVLNAPLKSSSDDFQRFKWNKMLSGDIETILGFSRRRVNVICYFFFFKWFWSYTYIYQCHE